MTTATIYIERNETELEMAIEGEVEKGCDASFLAPGQLDEIHIYCAVVAKDAPGFTSGTVLELTAEETERAEQALLENYSEYFEQPDGDDEPVMNRFYERYYDGR